MSRGLTRRGGGLRPFPFLISRLLIGVASLVPLVLNVYLLLVLPLGFSSFVLSFLLHLLAVYPSPFSLSPPAFAPFLVPCPSIPV